MQKFFLLMLEPLGAELASFAKPYFYTARDMFYIDFPDPFAVKEVVAIWREQGLFYVDNLATVRKELRIDYDKSIDEKNAGRFMAGLYKRMESHVKHVKIVYDKIGTTGQPLNLFISVGDVHFDLFTLNFVANPSMNLAEVMPHELALQKFQVTTEMAQAWIQEAFVEVKKLRSFK